MPVGNSILAALLAAEYRHLLPKLEHVTLKRGAVVYRADQDINEVYFPEDAVVAMVDTTDDRRTVEVGHDDAVTGLGEVDREPRADAAAGPGDDRDFAFQPFHTTSSYETGLDSKPMSRAKRFIASTLFGEMAGS